MDRSRETGVFKSNLQSSYKNKKSEVKVQKGSWIWQSVFFLFGFFLPTALKAAELDTLRSPKIYTYAGISQVLSTAATEVY